MSWWGRHVVHNVRFPVGNCLDRHIIGFIVEVHATPKLLVNLGSCSQSSPCGKWEENTGRAHLGATGAPNWLNHIAAVIHIVSLVPAISPQAHLIVFLICCLAPTRLSPLSLHYFWMKNLRQIYYFQLIFIIPPSWWDCQKGRDRPRATRANWNCRLIIFRLNPKRNGIVSVEWN